MRDTSGCWVLCDGLGGHSGGEVASRLAVDAALASFDADPGITPDALAKHVDSAHRAILDRQQSEPELASMRTTLVLLMVSAETALWAHVGDSRLYWFRDGKVGFQTSDDSVPQRLADAGEIRPDQIRFHEDRSRLLRSLGAKPEPGATIAAMPGTPQPGDVFLLATDGFWEWVTERQMEEDLAASNDPSAWLGRMEARLRGCATGDHDNYSAVAVRVTAKDVV